MREEAFQVCLESGTSASVLLCHTWGRIPLGTPPGIKKKGFIQVNTKQCREDKG